MAYRTQIVVDSVDPHGQADWWAVTLGWQVEPSDPDFIEEMVALGHASEADTCQHRGMLVWREGAAIRPADQPGAAPRDRIYFQRVPEPRAGKNRVHWDVITDGGDIDTVRDQLLARGAGYLDTRSQGPHSWHVMTDPEGNEFCLSG